ncbi:MAG: carbohydrate kinase family protein [Oscillospiraceae bacterium]|jgi:sugar/nucleoside kinase (ribokinase family)
MGEKKPYVVFLGGACRDKYFDIDSWPDVGDKSNAWHRGDFCGGMIANAACVCAGYGIETYSLDIKSSSPENRMLFEDLEKNHVHTEKTIIEDGVEDTYCVIYKLPGGEHTLFVVNGTTHPVDFTEEQMDFLKGAAYVYSPLNPQATFKEPWKAMDELKAAGVKFVFDCEASYHFDEAVRTIPYGTIVSFNEFSLEVFSEGRSFDEFKKYLFGCGIETIILTLGSHGARLVTRDDDYAVPCYDVEVVDTTGAGDTFNSSFTAAKVMGYPDRKALEFANAAANMSVTVNGPRGGITTREKVERFMAEHRR